MAEDKKHGKNDIDADEALSRARSAGTEVKPKDRGLYWATLAKAVMLQEIRDLMREDRTNDGSVESPEQAPNRQTAQITVVEE